MNKSTCTICSDYLTVANCTACPCGHTFHYQCIVTWRERSPTCPQCRVKFAEPIKLYFDLNNGDESTADTAALKNQISDLQLKIKEKDKEINSVRETQTLYMNEVMKREDEISRMKQCLQNSEGTNDALKADVTSAYFRVDGEFNHGHVSSVQETISSKQLTYLEKFKTEAKRARSEASEYMNKLSNLANIEELVKGERHEIEAMVKKYADTPDSLHQISASFVVLKKEFDKLKETKRRVEADRKALRKTADLSAQEAFESKEQLKVITNDITHLNDLNKSLQAKLQKLEQSLTSPSPRSSAIKRLLRESPAPFDLKKPRVDLVYDVDPNDESLILFDDPPNCDSDIGCPREYTDDLNLEEEQRKEIANEFGLNYVPTTSLNKPRLPLKDVNQKPTTKTNPVKMSANLFKQPAAPKLAHVKKGFNGMGGQSEILVIPTNTTGKAKAHTLMNEPRKLKIVKNSHKISGFMKKTPKLPRVVNSP